MYSNPVYSDVQALFNPIGSFTNDNLTTPTTTPVLVTRQQQQQSIDQTATVNDDFLFTKPVAVPQSHFRPAQFPTNAIATAAADSTSPGIHSPALLVSTNGKFQNEMNESGVAITNAATVTNGGGSNGATVVSSREIRNRAEKMRRDKLNSYISELSKLVPMIYNSPKKFDKASVLRLTVSYLRIHHTFSKIKRNKLDFPKIDQMLLDKLVTEQLNGFLLLLTTKAKIVFVSHTIEKLLGHTQNELLGQSIYSYVPVAEHEKLRRCLFSKSENAGSGESRRRCFRMSFVRNCSVSGSSSLLSAASVTSTTSNRHHYHHQQNLHNSNISSTTGPSSSSASSSTVQPSASSTTLIYEPVTFVGVSNHCDDLFTYFVSLRNLSSSSSGHGHSYHHQQNHARIDRPIEGTPDEYVTQHLLDGRIINCDQRVSLIAGYMAEEIIGISGFKFMHRSDVRWVMIALRQMYDRNESVGSSCYRLLARNGRFVYLCTRGFLEINKSDGTVTSMICVNTLVSERDGKKLNKEMKNRYMNMLMAANATTGDSDEKSSDSENHQSPEHFALSNMHSIESANANGNASASVTATNVAIVTEPIATSKTKPTTAASKATIEKGQRPAHSREPDHFGQSSIVNSNSSTTAAATTAATIEDPLKVDYAIQHLVSNLPSIKASDAGVTSVPVPAAVIVRHQQHQDEQPIIVQQLRQQFESQSLSSEPKTFGLDSKTVNQDDEDIDDNDDVDDEMSMTNSNYERNRKFVNILLHR